MEGCRPASPADLPRVAELARARHAEVRARRGGDIWTRHEAPAKPFEEHYAAVLDNPDSCLLIGTIDGFPVGFAVGEVDPLHDGARLGVIRDLYVEVEARGVGVGEALVERLLEFFTARGCVGVDGWALPGDRATKNFFEAQGFVSRLLVLHRPLPPPDGGPVGMPAGGA